MTHEELNLLEAFRAFGPNTGDPHLDRRRNEAARVLLAHMKSLQYRLGLPNREWCADAVGKVMLHLVRRGPRVDPSDGPKTEAEVQSYLLRAIKNNYISFYRAHARKRTVSSDQPDDPMEIPGPLDVALTMTEDLDRRQVREIYDLVPRTLDAIIDRVAASKGERAGRAFKEIIELLRRVYRGETSIEAQAREELQSSGEQGEKAFLRARTRLHKRASRARRDLHMAIEEAGRPADLPDPIDTHLFTQALHDLLDEETRLYVLGGSKDA